MAWFLALQGPPSNLGQSLVYELQESAERDKLAEEMVSSATLNRAVAVPVVFGTGRQNVTLYVRPAAWAVWAFYELSEEERRQMLSGNPLVNALAQAAAKQAGSQPRTAGGQPPLR